MNLNGKKAIVTGGSQGIGKGIAMALARAGAEVLIQYHVAKDKALKTVTQIQELGRFATAIQADFTEKAAPEQFMKMAIKELKGADILVNCAAAYERAPLLEVREEMFAKMQKVNVEVPLRLIQCFAKHLIELKAPGSIINISSISGFRPVVGSSLNSCSKAALNMLTQCAALELAPYQIRVNGIAPGATETESNQPSMNSVENWRRTVEKIPLGRAGKPNDFDGLVVLLASNESSWLTGVTIACDGGTIISY